MPEPIRHRLRVRYNECDRLGIVFNANYLVYADIAVNELWRERLGGYSSLMDEGLDLAVASAEIQYLAPLRFDDEIDLVISVGHVGNKSMSTVVNIEKDGTRAAEIKLSYVCVDQEFGKSQLIPDRVRSALDPDAGPDDPVGITA